MDEAETKILGMASPAMYLITVVGLVPRDWTEWFEASAHQHCLDGKPHTHLTCKVRDQAELLGILNRLNGLNLPLLQVALIHESDL